MAVRYKRSQGERGRTGAARAVARGAATVAAAAVLVAAAATPATAIPGGPASAITCTYRFTAWPGGFAADLSIANGGPAINGWAVHWTLASPTTNIIAWQADMSRSDAHDIIATNLRYNAVINTGQVTSFGWSAKATSTEVPTDITVNGTRC